MSERLETRFLASRCSATEVVERRKLRDERIEDNRQLSTVTVVRCLSSVVVFLIKKCLPKIAFSKKFSSFIYGKHI